MIYRFFKSTFLFVLIAMVSCGNNLDTKQTSSKEEELSTDNAAAKPIVVGADRTEEYLPLLKGKRVGVVGNQTSIIGTSTETNIEAQPVHLVDSLVSLGVEIVKVFAPEHGFRGTADAGEVIKDGVDVKTGLPILSLYGDNKKPSAEQLEGIEVMIFDIQDVGTRFYTYISTLHYVMEACAENNIPLIVFDRPNPNGHYVDGPVLEPKFKSFVGMQQVPVVYGMTMGEYAKMLCGENLFDSTTKAKRKQNNWNKLTVIKNANYDHNSLY